MWYRDRFIRVILVVIAALLAGNLAAGLFMPGLRAAEAAQKAGGNGDFRGFQAGVALATSSDGKVVYAADLDDVYRSLDYGKPGSWEHVLE